MATEELFRSASDAFPWRPGERRRHLFVFNAPRFSVLFISAAGFRRLFDKSQLFAGGRSREADRRLSDSSILINNSGVAQNSKSGSYGWEKADFPRNLPF